MDAKYFELTNDMQDLCNELDNYLKNCTFEYGGENDDIDRIGKFVDYFQVTYDALLQHSRRENYKLKDMPKRADGSYEQIYVYRIGDRFDGYWTEGTPEAVRQIDLGQDRDWSCNSPSNWDDQGDRPLFCP